MRRLVLLGCLLAWCLGSLGCGSSDTGSHATKPLPSRLKKPTK